MHEGKTGETTPFSSCAAMYSLPRFAVELLTLFTVITPTFNRLLNESQKCEYSI